MIKLIASVAPSAAGVISFSGPLYREISSRPERLSELLTAASLAYYWRVCSGVEVVRAE